MEKKIVLMYHDVYIDSPNESGFQSNGANHYKITKIAFEEQLQIIKRYPITMTFDDGGISFYTIIAPLLEKHGLVGHFYIPTDRIGCDGFLTETQIKDLHRRGHVIGSHSCSHPADFREISYEMRRNEWNNSTKILSSIIGEPVKEVSIPNGFLQEKDFQIFKALGITTIYTSKIGEWHQYDGMNIIGRVGIDKNMSKKRIVNVLSRGFFYKMLLVKQSFLLVLKVLLGNQYNIIKKIIRTILK